MSEFGKVEVTSTPAESSFFRALSLLKLYIVHCFLKKGVEIWAFDGSVYPTSLSSVKSDLDWFKN